MQMEQRIINLTFVYNDGTYTFSKMGYDDMFSDSLTKGATVSALYVQKICRTLALKAQNAKDKFVSYNSPHFTHNCTLFLKYHFIHNRFINHAIIIIVPMCQIADRFYA